MVEGILFQKGYSCSSFTLLIKTYFNYLKKVLACSKKKWICGRQMQLLRTMTFKMFYLWRKYFCYKSSLSWKGSRESLIKSNQEIRSGEISNTRKGMCNDLPDFYCACHPKGTPSIWQEARGRKWPAELRWVQRKWVREVTDTSVKKTLMVQCVAFLIFAFKIHASPYTVQLKIFVFFTFLWWQIWSLSLPGCIQSPFQFSWVREELLQKGSTTDKLWGHLVNIAMVLPGPRRVIVSAVNKYSKKCIEN